MQKHCCLAVPRRVQLGDVGCGLYAVGMLMDYWHSRQDSPNAALPSPAATATAAPEDRGSAAAAAAVADDFHGADAAGSVRPKVNVALVKPMDSTIGAQNTSHYSVQPNTTELLLTAAQRLGYTRYGETYATAHLCEIANHFGYSARLHRSASLRTLIDLIDKGHPPIVCVDIDLTTFQPASGLRGQHTHFVVVEGYFDTFPTAAHAGSSDAAAGKERAAGAATSAADTTAGDTVEPPRFLLVKQSGARAPVPTVWAVEDFLASWSGAGWEGRYRKRAMPREIANRIALCGAHGGDSGGADSGGLEGAAGRGMGVRLDVARPAMDEDECKVLWAQGIALGILEAAQVQDGAGDAGDASSAAAGCVFSAVVFFPGARPRREAQPATSHGSRCARLPRVRLTEGGLLHHGAELAGSVCEVWPGAGRR